MRRLALTCLVALMGTAAVGGGTASAARAPSFRIGPLATVAGARDHGGVPYAAVGFTVGPEPELRRPVLAGEPLEPPATGITRRYHAVGIRSTSRGRRGTTIVLATNDPAGRRVMLRIGRGVRRTIVVRARVQGPGAGDISAVAMAFASDRREAFHGFGGRRESTNLRGRSFLGWVLDYRYPDPSTGYYAPQ